MSNNYNKHPFYIFGSGVVAGVVGTAAVISFLLLPNYVQKTEAQKYLRDSGYVVLSSTEYDQFKRKKPNVLGAKNIESNLAQKHPLDSILPKKATGLSDFITAVSLPVLRVQLGTRKLGPLEEDLELSKLRGVYGYTVPWSLNSDPTGVGLSLSKAKGITHVMEVHKSKDGTVYVIAFISEQVRIRLEDSTRKASFQTTIFFAPYKENNKAIAIPVDRIERWQDRSPEEIGCIADVNLR